MANNKKSPKETIQDASIIPEQAYVTWSDDNLEGKQLALDEASKSLDEFTLVQKSTAASRRYSIDYSNLDSNTSGRPGLTRTDYDYFRPDEAVPSSKHVKLILKRAEDIYNRVGLVKNVIDLMGDFATQGISLVHPDEKIQRFYRKWFKKINGKDRSERFLNNLYKTGNVVISKQTAKINKKIEDSLYKTIGLEDLRSIDIKQNDSSISKKEIPWIYTFLDPAYVESAGGSLSSFVHNKRYEVVLPTSIRKIINSPKSEAEKEIVNNLPNYIVEAAKGKNKYPLDPNKVSVFHYKKDDWQSWAFPMIYSIMDDITVIEKLKLADMAALDGAISNIRIFKLGNLEHKIAPTKAATAKLAQILGNNVGGGTMDLVWGPDIELLESRTNVHQFLGEGKYVPHLNSVYAGLGIPPTLTGTFGAAGTTNNFISLKTLTQRLQYGRDVLSNFWNQEIENVQKAMGFKYPARIQFDRMDLSNEESEKALLIQLADRSLISEELLHSRFGFDPEMEKVRLKKEHRSRKSKKMTPKAGPWHDPQPETSLKKIALQSGIASPSEVGLELLPKKNGESSVLDLKQQEQKRTKLANDSTPESLPGEPQQGRPKNSKDSNKRQEKTFKPQTGAKLNVWALTAQDKISQLVNPLFLQITDKKSLRALSSEEYKELEKIKTTILLNTSPNQIISADLINNIASCKNEIYDGYLNWLMDLQKDFGRELSQEEKRQIKASYYSMVYTA